MHVVIQSQKFLPGRQNSWRPFAPFVSSRLNRPHFHREAAKYAKGAKTLAWAIALGILLRLASALYQGDAIQTLPGVYDQISYHALAARVIGGDGFSFAVNWWPATRAGEPTAHWSYLYTLYLTFVYGLFGQHPLAARVIQALISGVLHPWLSWRIGRRLFDSETGSVAAL